jgi:hypothetical protein
MVDTFPSDNWKIDTVEAYSMRWDNRCAFAFLSDRVMVVDRLAKRRRGCWPPLDM